ncbi:CopG family transcriptional regulator [Salmonella enterica subsp. diarizonae]|uniref:CopG family transcriptional regulator n=2 Tax=Salmonella enterica TaxID=28901 RepID=A0A759WGD7_SALER|nr:CopG family transcriptional regulator [Salmonella enterica subsp. diarizonae]EGV7463577.1 CopG family transcriptional regulator [Salmonella enterica]EIM5530194.1 CopG family transcriptional regulator [Salmonella enterica subsp. enterica]ECG8656181.1 CopG family transcriptional regulator [Salmonella enterica subsp. diarizonae]EDV3465772.1 CopG family transcriptional regulator [Salmonella enterica subsp. diarizonae]
MVKKPSQQASSRSAITPEQADELARRLADKPYGDPEKSVPAKDMPEKQCRTTISLYESMLLQVEDLALKNKRNGKEPKNVSAIIREALDLYLKNKK